MMLTDTIAAISTPLGEGGIAVIRVSGPEAIQAVETVFRSSVPLTQAKTHTVHYGYIVEPASGERVDEVLVTVMRAPRTFTKEDVVEIGCHGGTIAVRRVLDLLLSLDAVRLAEPGEFTKRAFLNGRIDLSQAEAVIDLIRAKSDKAFKIAFKQVEGSLSRKIDKIRRTLVELLAHIEVNIDYPEHDVEEMTAELIQSTCKQAMDEVAALLKSSNEGKVYREGIVTAIVGRPNVGKSSLLNALTKENRAIVTDIPGTTRDVIEEYVTINGIPLKLLDTAGIRETTDVVEQIGVERSKRALSDADLILFVVNAAEPLHEDDLSMMDELQERNVIVIANKTDLPAALDFSAVEQRFPRERIVKMSVLREEGIDALEQAISDIYFSGRLDSGDSAYVSNIRHIDLLNKAQRSLGDAVAAAEQGVPIDIVQIDVRNAWEQLGEIVGDTAHDSLIDQIFAQFCLGK